MNQHHNRIFVHMEKTTFVIKEQLVEPHRHQHYNYFQYLLIASF